MPPLSWRGISFFDESLLIMKSKHVVLSACLAFSLCASAKGTISGNVVNKQSGEIMDFVNVQLIDAKSGKALPIGASTDEEGKFMIPDVADGEYILKVSNIGSIDQERPVSVQGANVSVGTIHLADDSKLLQEVVVEGVRSQMRFELDKKVFSVDQDIASAGLSASEVLESIPSVEVDQDGEVSLRGNTSVTVWINGKESGLSADNRAQILEQIPGETIEKIEVITNPSAKYSPEGTAGIINIILKKDLRAGYYGSAEIGANTQGGGNANFNINYNSSKWDLFASVGFRMRHNTKGGSRMRRNFDATYDDDGTILTPVYYLNSDGTRKNHGNNLFIRAGATYKLTDSDEFYLNGFGMFGHRWDNSSTFYYYGPEDVLGSSSIYFPWHNNNMWTSNKGDNRGAHAELGYKHKWGDNHTIDIMGSYNFWGGPNRRYYHEQYLFDGNPEKEGEIDNYNYQEQNINVQSEEVKVDYVNQLLSWLKLEAGFAGNYSTENTPVKTWGEDNLAGNVDYNLLPADKALWNRFIYNNNVSALYFTLGGKVKDFSFSAGLRGEYWLVRFKSLEYDNFDSAKSTEWTKPNKNGLFALFPSVFLSYSLPYDNEVQINYTRRLRRPWGGQLNNFVDISDPTNISFGNPALEPEYTNSFELNYIKSWTMHMISLSAYLRTGDNKMERISYLKSFDDQTQTMYSTWANVGKQTNSGVEIVVKNSFWRGKIDLTTTVNLYNNHMSAWSMMFTPPKLSDLNGDVISQDPVLISGKKQNAFAWDARMMFSIKLPWSLSVQATGRYSSKQLTAQGSRQPGWSVDAGIRKTLGNWSFSISGRDLFDSRKFKNIVYGYGDTPYTQTTERWRGGRRIQFTIKYSFGNMGKQNGNRQQEMEPSDSSGYGEMEF